ncbi:acyl-CoA dehydrogenase family protein [Roseomonas sp. GC11]|uniref:acyl-CoA dehydrogenase family protein n=1 Tax=Roseomonas sp. GC11 TaxID=2950546 RepID=UPI0021096C70|nr:acyl-CoA dehydrogenase family protein [Roseomonas sp. GC11]MCQ4162846.1 acyl-CoA dehydrogenase family protein [Roseomonas sp. GC11]
MRLAPDDTLPRPQLPPLAAPATPEPSPEAAALRAAIRRLLPEIRARAAEAERLRHVPQENVAALREAGLFRTVQPRLFGGLEQDFSVLVELVMEIAAACPSTGWACGLLAAHQWLVAAFPEAAQREVWGATPEAVACASYAPTGQAVPIEGGYRLSGRWAFASGCDAAHWAICSALLPGGEGQPPQLSFLLVPRGEISLDDTWHTVGLAGTGSKTLVLRDCFVPAHRVLRVRDTATGSSPGRQLHANPLYAIPMLCNIPSCLAATAVGAAAGALESYLDMTSQRVTRGAVAGGGNRMAEFPTIQLRVAEAAASVDAAREILLRDLRARAALARAGEEISIEDRIASRRGQAFATQLGLRAAEALNASTGGQGLDLANPVQRAWRDVNAVGRHISLNWDAVGSMYGQMALGLEPKGQY